MQIVRNKNVARPNFVNKLRLFVTNHSIGGKMNKHASKLAEIENQLADSELYSAEK